MVLDSWPLLERARRGRKLQALEHLLDAASCGQINLLMSEVNLGEFFYLMSKDLGTVAAEAALAHVESLPIEIVPVRDGDGMRAARLKAVHSLSYADCFCANVAVANKAPVITGDPDFLRLQRTGLLRLVWMGA